MPYVPLIGITTHSRNVADEVVLPGTYVDAIQAAGGNPILLPTNQACSEHLLSKLDGLVFSGGGDINPTLYNGEAHPEIYGIDEARDRFEFAIAQFALTKQIPVFGICRGMQMLVVASGGTLVEHVPDVYGNLIAHRLNHPRRPIPHNVEVMPNSRLARLVGVTQMNIVSWHHQAVRTVPRGWRIAAQADDGLIEAIENPNHPWMMALQWHPELSIHDPAHQKLFRSFIEAAACGFSSPGKVGIKGTYAGEFR